MSQMIYVKSMVCNRCIEAVSEELAKLDIEAMDITLGEVSLQEELSIDRKEQLKEALAERGFELLEDRNNQYIEQIKSAVISRIHHQEPQPETTFSKFLEREIGRDYSFLSTLFSSVEGVTIERYIILQKIEKVKELLIYDQLSLSQIAGQLDYSSVQHLSNQFKKITGMSPSEFKQLRPKPRKPLDQVR